LKRFSNAKLRFRTPKRKGRRGFWGICRRLIWSWWVWALIAIVAAFSDHWNAAISTGIAAVFTYLVRPPEVSPAYGLESKLQVDSEEFLSTLAGATGARYIEGNRVTILNNGDEFFPAMLSAIDGARQSVTIEAYIYWAGEIGGKFARALADRSKAGVAVKILLDSVGSSTIGKEILEVLESGGCKIAWYNPVFWKTIGRFNNRDHRKSLIVDGRVAFTGGAGIADVWTGHAQNPEHWRDIQVRVEGPAAIALQTGFALNWLATTEELISGSRYFPKVEPVGSIAVQTVLSSPELGSSAARILYYLAIVSAQHKLYIANAYFIPDEAGLEILVDARKRGVDVKIMIPGSVTDIKIAYYGGIHLYGKLLEAGVEIYEYNRTMLHQKVMVVDSTWLTIGTTNFDSRSFALHEESNVCIKDSQLGQEVEKVFLQDLRECKKVDLESWKRRGLITRIRGVAACFLRDQI
jgi:cardiolipin synthase